MRRGLLLTFFGVAIVGAVMLVMHQLSAAEVAALPRPRPKVVLVPFFDIPRRSVLNQGAVDLVFIPRADAGKPLPQQSLREQFDELFVVVTARNASLLP